MIKCCVRDEPPTYFPDQPFIPSQPAPWPWPNLQPTTEPQVLLLLRQLQTDVAELRQSHATMLKAVETFLEKMRPPEAYRNPKRKKSAGRKGKRK